MGAFSARFVRGDQDPLSGPSKRREDSEHSIFERSKDGGYRLRDNVLFHLYVSTSPCGDARLHSPYEITADRKAQPPPPPGPGPRAPCQATCADHTRARGLAASAVLGGGRPKPQCESRRVGSLPFISMGRQPAPQSAEGQGKVTAVTRSTSELLFCNFVCSFAE